MEIKCNQCEKVICTVDPKKHIGIQVQDKGYVYKLPILLGINTPLYFCNNSCQGDYYSEHFTTSERQKAKEIIDDLKKDIPKMVEDTINATKKFRDSLLLTINKEKDGLKKNI